MLEKSTEIKKMFIKYVFTREEKEKVGVDLASKYSERQALIDKKKEITSALSAEINAVEAYLTELAKHHNQGWKMTNHDCYEIFDYDKKRVYIHRADNDEQVNDRMMTSSEFQGDMFDKDKERITDLPLKVETPEIKNHEVDEREDD